MVIKIKKLSPEAVIPSYANPGDAGMDFYANEMVKLGPGERRAISTGISLAIPPGYVGLIWDKSGISSKSGLKVMGGVVDSGYRGEIKIIMVNLSPEPCVIEKGKKLAQMLIQPVERRKIIEVEELDDTKRGSGGFGSTGLN